MKYLPFLLLLFAVPCFAEGYDQKLDYTLDEQKLQSGEIQVFEEEYTTKGKGRKKRVVGVALIPAPPDTVWNVLEDWNAVCEFIPNLEYQNTIHMLKSPDKEDGVANTLIEVKFQVFYISIIYTLDVTFDKSRYRQEWIMLTDNQVEAYNQNNIQAKKARAGIKNIEGFSQIKPYDNGSQAMYYFAPIVETSIPVPDFIERALIKRTLNNYMDAIKKIVRSLEH